MHDTPLARSIRAQCAARRITQADLARRVRVSRHTVNLWANAKRVPSGRHLLLLARELDLDLTAIAADGGR